MKNDNDKQNKIRPVTIAYSVIIIAVAYLIAVGILIYGFGNDNRIVKASVKYVPYPAAAINLEKTIAIGELNDNLAAVKRFYEKQDFSKLGLRIDFSTEEGKNRLKLQEKQILNRMIEDKIIEILAKQGGVNITKEIVNQEVSRKLKEYGNSENLMNLYGWTTEDFKKKIVRADLYKDELEKIFESQTNNDESKNKIRKAKEELDNGKDFSDAAREYSEGSTAQSGGELGWVSREQLIPELAKAIFETKEEKSNEIIESVLGYHIVKIEEKKSEENKEVVKIRQIFVPKNNFADWLEEKMKGMKVRIFLKGYYWDKDNSEVQFKDENTRKMEKQLLEKSQGDASLIY